MSFTRSNQSKSLPWDVVEKTIAKEVKWLKETLLESPYREKNESYGLCKNCIYRRIAILIVSGKVRARDIKSTISLWGKRKLSTHIEHGEKWHSQMMKLVGGYFQSLSYKVIVEPNLNIGRADLGTYKKNKRNLFIEIGTVSLPKLLFNLESMEGSDFLLITDKDRAVEFSILKADYKDYSIYNITKNFPKIPSS